MVSQKLNEFYKWFFTFKKTMLKSKNILGSDFGGSEK